MFCSLASDKSRVIFHLLTMLCPLFHALLAALAYLCTWARMVTPLVTTRVQMVALPYVCACA